jgi:hypothetical protein
MSSVAGLGRDLASEYVASVIEKYAVQAGPGSAAVRAAEKLVPALREWAGRYLLDIGLSGSYAKGTATALGTDVDVFISVSDVGGRSMKDIYWGLFQFLAERGLGPQAQNVSIRVERDGVKVDLVPGRMQTRADRLSDCTNVGPSGAKAQSLEDRCGTAEAVPSRRPIDHTLYRRKKDSWMQTNVAEHIRLVSGSGRTREIRALKIWRERNRLDFPSFYLELTVIDALRGARANGLAGNVWRAFQYLADGFGPARVVDPANSNNIVSDDLSLEEKRVIWMAARRTLNTSSWEQILW